MTRYSLVARDPRTYRRIVFSMGAAWDPTTDPEVLARFLEQQAVSIARTWLARYGVPMPTPRIEWRVLALVNPAQLSAPV